MKLFTTVLAALLFCHGGVARAGLFDDDEARKAILELRQQVEAHRQTNEAVQLQLNTDLRKSVDDITQLRKSMLELSNQIESLRMDVARLRGQDEQFGRDLVELQRAQKETPQGIEEKPRKLLEPGRVSVDGREFVAAPSETQDFDSALAALRKGGFVAARAAFTDFLKRYPQSGYKPSALFWLGNAQYALRSYRDAIGNFRAVVTQASDHIRAPESLLSVANCHIELKDIKAARKALEELIKAYPKSEAAAVGKDRLAKLPSS